MFTELFYPKVFWTLEDPFVEMLSGCVYRDRIMVNFIGKITSRLL